MAVVHDAVGVGPSVLAREEASFVRLVAVIPNHRHRADLDARLGALQGSRWSDEFRLLRWHPALTSV